MFRKMLVAYDGSETAQKAFAAALELAGKYHAALRVLAVVQPPEPAEEVEARAVVEAAKAHYRTALQHLKEQARAAGTAPETHIAVGHPAEQILAEAEANGVDLIVLGHRGKSFVQRWLLGSVSRQVMNHAPCAVLVVR
jgi:nucleotide-binding universal stress UspA family protein